MSTKLFGTKPNQIPLNKHLGSMAYQDMRGVNVNKINARTITLNGKNLDASVLPFTPYGDISSTTIQTALQELDDRKLEVLAYKGEPTKVIEVGTGKQFTTIQSALDYLSNYTVGGNGLVQLSLAGETFEIGSQIDINLPNMFGRIVIAGQSAISKQIVECRTSDTNSFYDDNGTFYRDIGITLDNVDGLLIGDILNINTAIITLSESDLQDPVKNTPFYKEYEHSICGCWPITSIDVSSKKVRVRTTLPELPIHATGVPIVFTGGTIRKLPTIIKAKSNVGNGIINVKSSVTLQNLQIDGSALMTNINGIVLDGGDIASGSAILTLKGSISIYGNKRNVFVNGSNTTPGIAVGLTCNNGKVKSDDAILTISSCSRGIDISNNNSFLQVVENRGFVCISGNTGGTMQVHHSSHVVLPTVFCYGNGDAISVRYKSSIKIDVLKIGGQSTKNGIFVDRQSVGAIGTYYATGISTALMCNVDSSVEAGATYVRNCSTAFSLQHNSYVSIGYNSYIAGVGTVANCNYNSTMYMYGTAIAGCYGFNDNRYLPVGKIGNTPATMLYSFRVEVELSEYALENTYLDITTSGTLSLPTSETRIRLNADNLLLTLPDGTTNGQTLHIYMNGRPSAKIVSLTDKIEIVTGTTGTKYTKESEYQQKTGEVSLKYSEYLKYAGRVTFVWSTARSKWQMYVMSCIYLIGDDNIAKTSFYNVGSRDNFTLLPYFQTVFESTSSKTVYLPSSKIVKKGANDGGIVITFIKEATSNTITIKPGDTSLNAAILNKNSGENFVTTTARQKITAEFLGAGWLITTQEF